MKVADRDVVEVLQFRAFNLGGEETVLDPVFAELLLVTQWRQLPLRLTPCGYPSVSALGPLPAGVGGALGRTLRRSDLLRAVAKLDKNGGYGRGLSATDEAFKSLLRCRVGEAISAILWGDDGVWEDYTRPTLVRSAPPGCGWFVAWGERRRQKQGLRSAALLELETALQALADRLGDGDCFGGGSGHNGTSGVATAAASGELTALDACAYGHLAVLFSIPCEPSSSLHTLLVRFPSLAHFLDRIEMRFGAWPDARSFLAALAPSERTPAAAAALIGAAEPKGRAPWARIATEEVTAASASADGASPPEGRHLEWWEAWGWSWGGRRRRPEYRQEKQNEPPVWYLRAFSAAVLVSVATAVLTGCSPVPQDKVALMLRRVFGADQVASHARRGEDGQVSGSSSGSQRAQ